jgi:hypothetical protein
VIGLFSSPAYTWAVITAELLLGLWLASGLKPALAWAAALFCFSVFAGASMAMVLAKQPSCGCFGSLEVSPWITGALDLVVVAVLCLFRPANVVVGTINKPTLASWVIVSVPLVMAGAAKTAQAVSSRGLLNHDGTIAGNSYSVSVETGNWAGQQLPLLSYVDMGPRLLGQNSLVLVYHAECPRCKQALSALAALDESKFCARLNGAELVLIDASRHLSEELDTHIFPRIRCRKAVIFGRLDPSRRWQFDAPLLVEVRQGIVVCSWSGDAALAAINDGLPDCTAPLRRQASTRRDPKSQ